MKNFERLQNAIAARAEVVSAELLAHAERELRELGRDPLPPRAVLISMLAGLARAYAASTGGDPIRVAFELTGDGVPKKARETPSTPARDGRLMDHVMELLVNEARNSDATWEEIAVRAGMGVSTIRGRFGYIQSSSSVRPKSGKA